MTARRAALQSLAEQGRRIGSGGQVMAVMPSDYCFGVVVVESLLSVALSPAFIGGTALSIAAAGGCSAFGSPGVFIVGVAESIALVGASAPGFVVGVGVSCA